MNGTPSCCQLGIIEKVTKLWTKEISPKVPIKETALSRCPVADYAWVIFPQTKEGRVLHSLWAWNALVEDFTA